MNNAGNAARRALLTPKGVLIALIALVVGLGGTCWWIVHASNVEMATRQEINALVEKADTAFSARQYDDAATTYAKAFHVAKQKGVSDDDLAALPTARANMATAEAEVNARKVTEEESRRRKASEMAAAAEKQKRIQAAAAEEQKRIQAAAEKDRQIKVKADFMRRDGHFPLSSDEDLARMYDRVKNLTGN